MLDSSASTSAPEHHLNTIYMTVLQSTIHEECLPEEKQNMYSFLQQVLGTIVLLYSPLSVNSLSTLLDRPKDDIKQGLVDRYTILDIPKDTPQPIRLHHPSLP